MKFKKIISAAVGAVMLCASLPFSSTTVDFIKDNVITAQAETTGKCGDFVNYSLNNDGVLTISGGRKMTDYDYGKSPFYDNDLIKSVIIEDGITSIGSFAFSGCTNLTSVTIPDSVTSIGNSAFWCCTYLSSITIPNSVTLIGDRAFCNCENITNITIPNEITYVGSEAFYGCEKITEVTIPNSVTSIYDSTFAYCTNLINVTIPNSVDLIGSEAFSYTKWIKNKQKENPLVVINNILIDGKTCSGAVVIPDYITSIGASAFAECTSIESVIVSDSVTSIGYRTFWKCEKLTDITLSDSINSIADYAFGYCTSLTNIKIPDSVTSIGCGTFWECEKLTNIKLSDSITSIGFDVFYNCKSLSNIVIPDSVASIDDGVFLRCANLKSILIPNSVTLIDSYTFDGCTNLKDVYYSGTEEEWKKVDIDENGNDPLLNATIHFSSNPEETTEPTEEATTAVTATTKSTTTTTKRATTTVKLTTTTRKATTTTESLKTPTLLVLGDNVSTGSGLSDTNNSYASLIADYYGATYINYAQDGLMAEDLKISLENGDYDTELSKADYVLVTIGENDIISTVIEIIKKVAIKYGYDVDEYTNLKDFLSIFSSEDQQMIDEIIKEFAETISVRYISENYIKPCFYYISNHTNGKVVFQTVYNPFSINTSSSEWAPYKSRLDNINAKMDIYCSVMKKYYEKYANNYDNIQILDTYTNFEDHGETLTNIESMDINPNQAGHLYLAADIISLLGGKKVNNEKIKSSYDSLAEPYKSNLLAIDDAKTKILNLIDNTIEPPTETYDPVSISPKTIELVQGEKTKIEITGGDKNYKFVLSDDEKVVISPDGMVTALKPGIVKIIVVDGVGNTDTITVTITAFTQPVTEPLTIISTEESSTTETPTSGENNLYGDINVDDNVTIADAVLLNKYLVNSATLSEQGKINADAYFDKVITSADTLAILKLIVGTYDSLPIYP